METGPKDLPKDHLTAEAPPESAVDRLLQREASQDYVKEWELFLGREKSDVKDQSESAIVIFRLGSELLALSSLVIGQIIPTRHVHRIPHLKGSLVKGLVNVNGRLLLHVSLAELLEVELQPSEQEEGERPMILFERENEVWTFAVTEVLGVFHCDLTHLKNVPVTVAKSSANYIKGVIHWRDKYVALLDEDLLIFSLKRSV